MFCGVLAGLIALLVPTRFGGDLLTMFLKLWGTSAGQQMMGTLAWYVPVVTALLGGLLAFVVPSVGALLLGTAGAAWLGLSVVDSSFFRPELLVPSVLSSAGALIAFLTAEFEFRSRRAVRRRRGEMVRNGGDSRDQPSPPDRDNLPDWPERRMRPVHPAPDEKQTIALEEARAREQARAREEAKAQEDARAREEATARVAAFFSSYTDFVNLLEKRDIAVPWGMRGGTLPSSLNFIYEPGPDGYPASTAPAIEAPSAADPVRATGWIEIAVVGAHESGVALNPELIGLGGTFIRTVSTTPHYTLYALPNTSPPKSGLLRSGSTAIAVGVWSLDAAGFGEFASRIRSPLCIGTLSLDDGTSVMGLLVEAAAVQGAQDISHFGRWRVPHPVTRLPSAAHGQERRIVHGIPNIEADVSFTDVSELATVPPKLNAATKAGELDAYIEALINSRQATNN